MLTASYISCKIPIKILIVQVGLDWPGYIESLQIGCKKTIKILIEQVGLDWPGYKVFTVGWQVAKCTKQRGWRVFIWPSL